MIPKRTLAGRKIFPIGLGVMVLDEYSPSTPEQEAVQFLRFAAEQGIELFDTADVYGLGRNEELIGKAFSPSQQQKLLIATKGGCTRPGGRDWDTDGRPEHLEQVCRESLKRLGVEQIYLYQLHAPDHRVPFLESIKALKELQEEGLIYHIGLSNVSLEQLKQVQKLVTVVSVQNHFNLAYKRDEKELLPYLTQQEIAYIPYFPLGSGQIIQHPGVLELAREAKCTPSQLALAWIVQKWPTAIPIPGTKRKEHLIENRNMVEVELSASIMKKADELF